MESGIQTCYHTSPPEAIASTPYPGIESPPVGGAKLLRWSSKKVIILIITFLLVATALVAGLGLGLMGRKKGNNHAPAEASPNVPSSQLRIMDDTSLSAISLPGGDRKVFFQEATGLIHQMSYSSKARKWGIEAATPVVYDAKNNTPLAVIPYPESRETLQTTSVCNNRFDGLHN